jgi:hypothetical protein
MAAKAMAASLVVCMRISLSGLNGSENNTQVYGFASGANVSHRRPLRPSLNGSHSRI